MARVYRVRHTTLLSEHALKVLTVQSASIKSRLIAEGRAQAKLQHPNAITVTDVVDVDGSPGLVLEYVEGGTLTEWAEERPSRARCLQVFKQICRAVARAHGHGWVHRDLKPDNVLIKYVGDQEIAKVADFGLVKAVLGSEIREGYRTRGGLPMGTPGFMAPEQIEDAASVDARADVFSLGCILVWLLTGEQPFEAPTMLDMFARVATGTGDTLPPNDPLYSVAQKALRSNPAERYADAGSLLEALESPVATPVLPSEPMIWGAVAALGVGAVVFISVVGTVVIGGLLLNALRGDGCSLGGTEAIGYVRVDAMKVRRGVVRTLSHDSSVFAAPGDEEPVCVLPEGTKIEARRSTRTNLSGAWLEVVGDAVTLP